MTTKAVSAREVAAPQQDTRRLTLVGAAFAAIGVLAILLPTLATLTAELLVAALFALWGGVGLWFAWEMQPAPEWRYAAAVFGLLLLAGIVFMIFPVAGVAALTILMMISFLMEGILSVIFGLRSSSHLANWGWLIFSGVCSLIIGLVILIGWPGTARWMLGLLMGVNFLSSGLSLIMLGRAINTRVT